MTSFANEQQSPSNAKRNIKEIEEKKEKKNF